MKPNQLVIPTLVALLCTLPLTAAYAADNLKSPSRPDDPVDPVPENPSYAGWGYVCQINPKKPGTVIITIRTASDCSSSTTTSIRLCLASAVDTSYCPQSADPDHLRAVYSESEQAMVVALAQQAMTHRHPVQALRNEYYGFDPGFNGTTQPNQHAHRLRVNLE